MTPLINNIFETLETYHSSTHLGWEFSSLTLSRLAILTNICFFQYLCTLWCWNWMHCNWHDAVKESTWKHYYWKSLWLCLEWACKKFVNPFTAWTVNNYHLLIHCKREVTRAMIKWALNWLIMRLCPWIRFWNVASLSYGCVAWSQQR